MTMAVFPILTELMVVVHEPLSVLASSMERYRAALKLKHSTTKFPFSMHKQSVVTCVSANESSLGGLKAVMRVQD